MFLLYHKTRLSYVAATLLLGSSLSVSGAVISVNTNYGGSSATLCTLRDAMNAADTDTATGACPKGSGADEITFTFGSAFPIVLNSRLPEITQDVSIKGIEGDPVVIQRNDAASFNEMIEVNSASVSLSDIIIQDGLNTGIAGTQSELTLNRCEVTGTTGTGVFSYTSSLSMQDCTISKSSERGVVSYYGDMTITDSEVSDNNVSGFGAGVLIYIGSGEIVRSTISGNTADSFGGGLNAYYANVSISDSTISDNRAVYGGGGIRSHYLSEINISNSTISGNWSGQGNGAGILNYAYSQVNITNSTISNNLIVTDDAAYKGGGIYNGPQCILNLQNVTIAFNNAFSFNNEGSGIYNANPLVNSLNMQNSILFGNGFFTTDTDGAPPTINYNNIFGADGANWNLTCTGCIVGVDPLLAPLADNGGPTWTYALRKGSPAIDAGRNTDCPGEDQRHKRRKKCDIGAYEYFGFTSIFPAIYYLLD